MRSQQEQFTALRREIDAGLSRIESSGESVGDAAIELIKIGVVLSLATHGPEATLSGLAVQHSQLAKVYPAEAARAEVIKDFPAVRGSA